MAGEPNITITGNVTADADLQFTNSGIAVASFTVAHTTRTKDGDKWVDGDTTWYRCSVWRDPAEHVAETLTKGMRVIVTGRLRHRPYEHKGEKRVSVEIDVDEVGPSLRYATAKVNKMARATSRPPAEPPSHDDPWAASPPAVTGTAADDEPPF